MKTAKLILVIIYMIFAKKINLLCMLIFENRENINVLLRKRNFMREAKINQ